MEDEEVFVCPVAYLNDGDQRLRYMDFYAIDFLKILKASTGLKLNTPDNTECFAFENYNINLSLLICKNNNQIENKRAIFDSLKAFINGLNDLDARVMKLSIGVEYEWGLAKLPLIFKPKNFLRYIQNYDIVFPAGYVDFGKWIENV